MSVFRGLVKKGELGGFGLENMGDISKLNGNVKLAESFTPTELTGSPIKNNEDEEIEDEERQQFQRQTVQPVEEEPPEFFDDKGKPDKFFGKSPDTIDFFGSKINKKSSKKVTSGIPDTANIFNDNIKVKQDKPLIGNLKEGVSGFDSSFGNQNALKRGTGFDNFVGTIDVNRLARGLPDSAVPKVGIFSKKVRKTSITQPVDLSKMRPEPLPIPRGFEDIDVEESIEAFEEPKRKAGRPKGSVGKKKRQARKIEASKKKKKKKEVDKARVSLLKERARLKVGGAPRSALQQQEASTIDNSFRGFFT